MNAYINNIYKLIELLENKHIDCYFNVSKEELTNYINEILSKYKLEDDYDFYYISNMIIKRMFGQFDSHTKIIFKNTNERLPIRLKYIEDKLYILNARADYSEVIYGQITSINDININKLINELELIIPYSTKEFLESQIEYTFYNGSKIKSLPSIDSSVKNFKYTILKNGKEKDIYLEASDIKFTEDINYTFDIIDRVMIIHYTSCVENYENQMLEFVEKINLESMKNNIQKYVVDIRGNSGGNSEIIKPLILYLQDKEIITLIDKYVFSGGRFALIDLINIGSKTVGTGIGTSINCFGNISRNEIGNFILPISNKYFFFKDNEINFIRNKDDFNLFKNNKQNQEYFIPIIYEPDYTIYNKIADYENNKDAVLEYAIKALNEEKTIYK